jgi:putative ABC transport system permease protein
MLNNKWMLICTLLGAIITVALLSSIPTYTEGIMQRMLTKDFDNSLEATKVYPGGYQINFEGFWIPKNEKSYQIFQSYDKKVENEISKKINLPILAQATFENAGLFSIAKNDANRKATTTLCSLSELEKHIKILYGRLYTNKVENGVHEIILTDEAVKNLNLTLGNTYNLGKAADMTLGSATALKSKGGDIAGGFKIKVVGIFTYKTLDDLYWYTDISKYKNNIFMSQDVLNKSIFVDKKHAMDSASWYFAYDYHEIKISNLNSTLTAFRENDSWILQNKINSKRSVDSIIVQTQKKIKQLEITLVVLMIPILAILSFYSFMVSKLKIDFESNEIAVIKSRGGSSLLIFGTYLIESLIISVISLLVGPLLGLYLCKVLGSSNGFLEFVQRSALPLKLSVNTYVFSVAAVIFISLSMLLPALIASQTSIVLYKQKNSRYKKTSFWKKYFLDVALLALSVYGLYSYKRQQRTLLTSGMNASDMVIDPLLFIISVLFIFGCSLLFLRIFPYIVRFIFWIGKKIWNPVFYASFIQVGRATGWEQFTMIFIILALSIGIFNSNSARTINKNMEEKIYYETGADTVVQGHWTNNQPPPIPGKMGPDLRKKEVMYYYEPSFDAYKNLSAAQSVTKVFKDDSSKVYFQGNMYYDVSIMGIIPNEFGKTSWFRSDLLPFHWYQYLNLMTDSPSAVLVSRAFKDKLGAKEGDQISVGWGQANSNITGTIYAFIDYWPTLNPSKKTNNIINPYFIVANLNFMQEVNLTEPYQVWLKKKPGATLKNISDELTSKKVDIDSITDAAQKIILSKNDPMLQGTNGALTLGFITTMIITVLGFLIYWILSIKKRSLQFGIFRAIGLTSREVVGMIACEQIFITGSSIFAGIGLGNITSKIFVPLFQMVYSSEQQVPPFKVISDLSDYLRLYTIVALMLILCFIIIGRLIFRINISQALKLGED